tara:strand:+ start:3311 stop:3547 length:237 start_codon:yes stop_codon:yes gene_type:complete
MLRLENTNTNLEIISKITNIQKHKIFEFNYFQKYKIFLHYFSISKLVNNFVKTKTNVNIIFSIFNSNQITQNSKTQNF